MAVVWIVQNKLRNDRPLFNFTPAKQFGELKFLLTQEDSGLAQQPLIFKLKRELFKFKKEDSLLLVGAPELIGAAMVVVAQVNSFEVPVLFYEKYTKTYFKKVFKF